MLAHISDLAVASPIAFVAGMLAGFILANRWKIIRRNGG